MSSPYGTSPARAAASRPWTKVVATIGPASEDHVGDLIGAGMSVARVNFSHGTPDAHRRLVERVRAESRARATPVGILADLPGPKMRLGRFQGGERVTAEGQLLCVRQGDGVAGPGEVLFNFGGFLEAVQPGHRMVLADGQCVLVVEEVRGDSVLARVARPGLLGDGKGVHMPDSPIAYELPTPRDREFIELAKELDVDMLGISFVGRGEEIEEIRSLAGDRQMVAKIERKLACERLDGILAAADGVMVARGDLGVELELEQVPLAQKNLLLAARRAGRFTITATEMLESMTHSSRPTRAEVADVANAVLDGSDALMLSAETAIGSFPVEAVRTMARIASTIEQSRRYLDLPRIALRAQEIELAEAVARAAVEAADALDIEKIVCLTESGRTAALLSLHRPRAEIFALSPRVRSVDQMTILSHVRPLLFRRAPSLEEMLSAACELLVARGLARQGEAIVFVGGVPPGVVHSTNVMKIHRIGEERTLH